MPDVFAYLGERRVGVSMALLCVLTACLAFQWLLWTLGRGRFAAQASGSEADAAERTGTKSSTLRYLAAELFARIITEFRHFLALVIVLVFAGGLFAAMYPGLKSGNVTDMVDGIQAVAASLGGLLGSIIGYYFGESAARAEGSRRGDGAVESDAAQDELVDIRPARTPAALRASSGGAGGEPMPEEGP